MEQKGFPLDSGPLAVMRDEHEIGRNHIRAMDEAIDGSESGNRKALASFVHHASAYVLMLRDHIEKEDHCLFSMADQALSADDQQELAANFERVDHDFAGRCHPARANRPGEPFGFNATKTADDEVHH